MEIRYVPLRIYQITCGKTELTCHDFEVEAQCRYCELRTLAESNGYSDCEAYLNHYDFIHGDLTVLPEKINLHKLGAFYG